MDDCRRSGPVSSNTESMMGYSSAATKSLTSGEKSVSLEWLLHQRPRSSVLCSCRLCFTKPRNNLQISTEIFIFDRG